MDLLNDILKTQKLAREDKIKSFQSMFSEEPVAVKQAKSTTGSRVGRPQTQTRKRT